MSRRRGTTDRWQIANEFASVEVCIDQEANDSRLCIKDLKTGATSFLDALELACLAERVHEMRGALVDPSMVWERDPRGSLDELL